MPKTQIKCPRCQQPTVVQIEQLFDVSSEPESKQRLLGGTTNHVNCSSCGYSGSLATPIVYHDNDKELLLTFFPPELGMPLNEQEKNFGQLVNKIVDKLVPEKRKAYLFRPQSFLTYQSLVERILGADGITPEMIKAQQGKANLMERLLAASTDEIRKSVIQKDEHLVDAEFFALFSRLMESAIGSGQEIIIKQMDAIQQLLLTETSFGKELQSQSNEIEEAGKTLQAAGNKLTREKLLDILLEAPNDIRLSALVSYTRPGMDYQFFQLLTDKIEKKQGFENERLSSLRNKLLDITKEIDQRMEAERNRAVDLLQEIMSTENLQKSITEHLPEINETFIRALNLGLQQATEKNDQTSLERLKEIVNILQKLSAPPPEYGLLQNFIEAPDENSLIKLITEHDSEITPEFTQFLSSIIAGSEGKAETTNANPDVKIMDRIRIVYRAILKYSMLKNLK